MTSEPVVADDLTFGDVVLVAFPFTSQVATKQRPAIVISRRAYNLTRPDVVLMAVTSRVQPEADDRLLEGWASAGLIKPSAIKPVIATLEQRLILRNLGGLGEADRALVRRTLEEVLG